MYFYQENSKKFLKLLFGVVVLTPFMLFFDIVFFELIFKFNFECIV